MDWKKILKATATWAKTCIVDVVATQVATKVGMKIGDDLSSRMDKPKNDKLAEEIAGLRTELAEMKKVVDGLKGHDDVEA